MNRLLFAICLIAAAWCKSAETRSHSEILRQIFQKHEIRIKRAARDEPVLSPLCINGTGYPISSAPFEIPGNCTHFYQCSNGYLFVMPCAPGTAFNPGLGVCDWPYNVTGCGRVEPTTTKPTTHPTTHESTTHATPDPLCINGTGYPISSAPFEIPGNCTHFYQCSNGYLFVMMCAPGTAFNPGLGVCDWPYNVTGCGRVEPTTTKPTTHPTTHESTTHATPDPLCINGTGYPISSAPFEIPGNCTHFYQCSNGYLFVMMCAPGTAFNPGLGVCDWPYNVTGCGRVEPTTTKPTTHPTTHESTTHATPDPLCINGTGYPISSAPFEIPGNCTHFYQCSNGYLFVMMCAPGTAFNPGLGVCDWPYNVTGCGRVEPTTTKPTTHPTTHESTTHATPDLSCIDASGNPISSDPFEKPGDCAHFYQCSNGYLYIMPCAPGTAFNPALGVCDWPYNVHGC